MERYLDAWVGTPAQPAVAIDTRLTGLDGLRAIALIAVFLFHADFTWARGGYLGVDLFFVISGFLITGLMANKTQTQGREGLISFYWRRAKRLFPVSWLMTISMIVAAMFFATDALPGLRFDVIASFCYVTNWGLIWHSTSYFEAMGRPPLLLHLWSLAIEEQFYILWAPIVLFGIHTLGRRGLAVIAATLAVAAGAWMAILATKIGYPGQGDPSRLYLGTDTHAFPLLIGATLGLLWQPNLCPRPTTAAQRKALFVLGFGALVAMLVLFTLVGEETAWLYPWGLQIAATVSALLILIATHRGSSFGRWLDNPIMRWIGERSYGMYLWHWPIFMLTRPGIDLRMLDAPTILWLRIVLTVGISALSYQYMELPIRHGALERVWHDIRDPALRRRAWRHALTMTMSLVMAFGVAGTILSHAPSAAVPAQDVRDALALAPVASGTLASPTVAPIASVAPVEPITPVEMIVTAPEPGLPPVENFTGKELTAVGDSVLLGSSRLLKATLAGADVHATMGSQAAHVLSQLKALAKDDQLRAVVLIHLGTNGYVKEKQLRQMLSMLADRKRVVLVNTQVPRRWMEPNNALFDHVVPDYPNVVLVRWRDVSDNQPDYFVSDGVHLTVIGQRAFIAEIMRVGHLVPDASAKPYQAMVDPAKSYARGVGDLSDTLVRLPQSVALDRFWNNMARCETDANWENSGRYPGGLGMSVENWTAWSGGALAPAEATPAQPIDIAHRLSTQVGTRPDGDAVKPIRFARWWCVFAVGHPPASSPYTYTPERVIAQPFHRGARGDVVCDLELTLGLPRHGIYDKRVRKRHLAYLKEKGLSETLAGSDSSIP